MGETRVDRNHSINPFALPPGTSISKTQQKRNEEVDRTQEIAKKIPNAHPDRPRQTEAYQVATPADLKIGEGSVKAADSALSTLTKNGVNTSDPKVRELSQSLGNQLASEVKGSNSQIDEQAIQRIINEAMQAQESDDRPKLPQISETDRTQIEGDLQSAIRQQEEELNRLKAQAAAGSDHLPNVQKNKELLKHGDVLHRACQIGLSAIDQASRTIRMHTEDSRRRTENVSALLDLDQLMQKYEDRESLDLFNPKTPDEEKDFAKMLQCREVAKKNGVMWDQNDGWKTAKDRQRYQRGVGAATGVLQSQNKVKDLELQQAIGVYTGLVLLVTNMILAARQLKQEITRNMKGG